MKPYEKSFYSLVAAVLLVILTPLELFILNPSTPNHILHTLFVSFLIVSHISLSDIVFLMLDRHYYIYFGGFLFSERD